MHKTGTTALQKVLCNHSDRLLKHGVRYVRAGREGADAHHELARSLWKHEGKSVWQTVRQELAESSCPIDLISSEGFWFRDPAELKKQLPDAKDIRVIAYLRRQDRYMQSLYKQTIAGGRKIGFGDWLSEKRRRGNYFSIIERWAAQFGRDAITIRPYERDGKTVDSIEDFGSFLGCDLVEQQKKKGKFRRNASPRRELLHFIRAFNKLDLEVDRDELFFSLIRRDGEYARSGDLLTATESIAMMQEYAEENRMLVEKYYGDTRGPLFPEMEENTAPPLVWGLDDHAFFDLTADVLDVVIGLAAEGKIRRRRDPVEHELEAEGSDTQNTSTAGRNQTRQETGNALPNRRRQ